ncbi:phosphatidylinositol/phosphatidylcholine transfer protein SFH9 [Andrographis paniculata]|uniref:phosphatidylinositol/phosphatidylcholine transfer protein SFH9 n=1 Tax=Andrographis paniculata TaxID=175694 RepID=UPI0021E979B7|nr:phosphatidylinositol/phosphatidylcholine transfer protein SFH9 [Andrographis paniculata]XP_051129936.1 phosphatidylinositol/phosphatidylcholine transfer protein SFH9 [Andrographis paniculata]
MASSANKKNVPKSLSSSSGLKSFVNRSQPLRPTTSHKWEIGKGAGSQVASFLIKTIALESIRRFSRSKCPLLWSGLQGLQVLCYPPLNWLQCWKPFGFLIKRMQLISRPLLVLSVVDALSDHSDCSKLPSNHTENSPSDDEPQLGSLSPSSSLILHPNPSTVNDHPEGLLSIDWLDQLHKELEIQGISLPERLNREELQRFYGAANGDMSNFLSSVKKTISWRETYRILSEEELEIWSNVVFWHGLDVKHRPCLIIRLGMGCRLPSCNRPQFVQAIVSQVEYGVLHLVSGENPQITVLVDCHGVSPLRFPMQSLRYCCNIFQDHFPNVLGCLIIIRLPSVVRVIAQTFIQVLKPTTKRKLRIEGVTYKKFLSEFFQAVPSYLGGQCTCTGCTKLIITGIQDPILQKQTSTQDPGSDIASRDGFPLGPETYQQYYGMTDNYWDQKLRAAVIVILIFGALIALAAGLWDPETRPTLLR